MNILIRIILVSCLGTITLSFVRTNVKGSLFSSCNTKVQNEEEVNDKEIMAVENSEDSNDPYGNLLDFNTPVDQNVSVIVDS